MLRSIVRRVPFARLDLRRLGSQWVLAIPFTIERERWFLWTAPLFGVGIATYFHLLHEPSWATAIIPFVAALIVRTISSHNEMLRTLATISLIIAAGFLAAKTRTETVRAPVLSKPIRAAVVTGYIERAEQRPNQSLRLTLSVLEIKDIEPIWTPQRVRISVRKSNPQLRPGNAIRIRARLSPPSPPALPRGYDFARAAYFQGLGGVGYALSSPEIVQLETLPPWLMRMNLRLQNLRRSIGQRIETAIPGEGGAMANALMTGERSGISKETNELYRDAGIFHILSISGLHMAIMGGSVFIALRFLFAALPTIALRYPVKKWAAIAGAFATLGYLTISGGAHPTVRSFIMIVIMFLAVLLDRPAIALRNVAIAALLILAVLPESLFNAGFQLSFAAVVALVAAYEAHRDRLQRRRRLGYFNPRYDGWWHRIRSIRLFMVGTAATTVIAGLATAPFAAFHFHTSQQYSVLTNMLAIPVSNLLVMPAALAAFIAIPFGLEAWPLAVMATGIEIMTWSARTVVTLPGAVSAIPAFPEYALQLMVIGGLWFCIWRQRWRWIGLLIVALGLYGATLAQYPDALIGKDGQLVAIRDANNRLAALPSRYATYDLSRWLEHDGDTRPVAQALSGSGKRHPFRCDLEGCTGNIRTHSIAIPRSAAALIDDCKRAALLVITFPRPTGCITTALIVDFHAIRKHGTHAVYVNKEGTIKVATVEQFRGHRPWTVAARRQNLAKQRHAQRLTRTKHLAQHRPAKLKRLRERRDADNGYPLYWNR